ncbi:MAG: HAMP domain-containing protein [Aphanothece sp. CMT-3BRIN-NPC111]|jgi:signal transduction histidine kinase|nr:HAMP domain-containing protein [Aphanothece sp. CMT-3BRIN-NPC111]
MNLRRKLLTIFGGLALLALVTAGMTMWTIAQWQATNNQLRNHYQRSLLLQRVRAATFRAFKEVPDAVTGDDPNSREEFKKYLEPAEEDFKAWAKLAETKEEKQQVQQVRQAYEILIKDANLAFDLVEAGRRDQAFQLMEGRLEDKHFQKFQDLTEAAVTSDQNYRQVVLAQVQNTRQTAQLVLAIAAFATISLMLLLAAYLASDLFSPLHEVKDALDDVARGDLQRRLDEERADELGIVNRAFNRMAEAMQEREQVMGLVAVPVTQADDKTDGSDWQHTPSRLVLHQLVSQLRSRVTQLNNGNEPDGNGTTAVEHKQGLVNELDQLLQAVARVTEFGFPLDLNLSRTDIRALLYEVLLRFHDELVRASISFELDIAPEVTYAVVDRLKLREALGELVRNALAALPERGGHLGIRSSIAADGKELLLEVADNGTGVEQPLINRAFTTIETSPGNRLGVGLKLTKAIVEQHGGHLTIKSEPGQGTYVQIKLPWRE